EDKQGGKRVAKDCIRIPLDDRGAWERSKNPWDEDAETVDVGAVGNDPVRRGCLVDIAIGHALGQRRQDPSDAKACRDNGNVNGPPGPPPIRTISGHAPGLESIRDVTIPHPRPASSAADDTVFA